jgi:hypothetical protein
MPGDPIECRHRSACFLELAKAATSEAQKAHFRELATMWLKIAVGLETVSAFAARK